MIGARAPLTQAQTQARLYPNWRDYFVESDILTQHARAFVAANANQNANQWDVGSDPHGMATAATITG